MQLTDDEILILDRWLYVKVDAVTPEVRVGLVDGRPHHA